MDVLKEKYLNTNPNTLADPEKTFVNKNSLKLTAIVAEYQA